METGLDCGVYIGDITYFYIVIVLWKSDQDVVLIERSNDDIVDRAILGSCLLKVSALVEIPVERERLMAIC